MEKVVPVVVVRKTGEFSTKYKIDKILCVDRHFELSSPYCPKQEFDNLQSLTKYVFEKIQIDEQYTMAHYSATTVKYDVLIIDVSDDTHTYAYTPEFLS